MDLQSLSRRELQALCKKNKIPANITNVAMIEALTSLEKVEGLGEFMNATESDSQQSPVKNAPGSPANPKTGCRISTRKKWTGAESEGTQVGSRSRRTTRRTVVEESNQETENVNQYVTPAAPVTRRRAIAGSTRRKLEAQVAEIEIAEKPKGEEQDNLPESPAIQSRRTRATTVRKLEAQKKISTSQGVKSIRRSVRFLEKSLENLSLMEDEKDKVETANAEELNFENQNEDDKQEENEKDKVEGAKAEDDNNENENEEVEEKEEKDKVEGANTEEQNNENEDEEVEEKEENGPGVTKSEVNIVTDVDVLVSRNLDKSEDVDSERKMESLEINQENINPETTSESSGLDAEDEDRNEISGAVPTDSSENSIDVVCGSLKECESLNELRVDDQDIAKSTDVQGSDVSATEGGMTLNAGSRSEIQEHASEDSIAQVVEDSAENMDHIGGASKPDATNNSMNKEELMAENGQNGSDDADRELDLKGNCQLEEHQQSDDDMTDYKDEVSEKDISELNVQEGDCKHPSDLSLSESSATDLPDHHPVSNLETQLEEEISELNVQEGDCKHHSDPSLSESSATELSAHHQVSNMETQLTQLEDLSQYDVVADVAIPETKESEETAKCLPVPETESDAMQQYDETKSLMDAYITQAECYSIPIHDTESGLPLNAGSQSEIKEENNANRDSLAQVESVIVSTETVDQIATAQISRPDATNSYMNMEELIDCQPELHQESDDMTDDKDEVFKGEISELNLEPQDCKQLSDASLEDLPAELGVVVDVAVTGTKEFSIMLNASQASSESEKSASCPPVPDPLQDTMQQYDDSQALIDVRVSQAEGFGIPMAETAIDQSSSTPSKIVLPAIKQESVVSPFSSHTIQGQFPHPAMGLTPRVASTGKHMITHSLDTINKENMDNSGMKLKEVTKGREKEPKKLEDMSIRVLTKMLKEKLHIRNKKSSEEANNANIKAGEKAEKKRLALQMLTENCM